MARKYYTAVSQLPDGGKWAIEFGDFARSVVADEIRDMKDNDRRTYKRNERPKYMIINHDHDKQLQTVAVLNKINGY